MDLPNSSLGTVEENTSELEEDRSIQTIQTDAQSGKKNEKKIQSLSDMWLIIASSLKYV